MQKKHRENLVSLIFMSILFTYLDFYVIKFQVD